MGISNLVRRAGGVTVALLLAGALVLAACGSDDDGGGGGADDGGTDTSTERGDTLRFGVGSTLASFNPNSGTTAQGVGDVTYLRPVYDTLVDTSASDGTIEPSLAERWEVDGRVVTFFLRDDVDFHDGSHFDSASAKATFDYANELNLQNAGPDSVPPPTPTVIDEYTISLEFHETVSNPVANYGGKGGMMVSAAKVKAEATAKSPEGSGPYLYDAGASTEEARYVYRVNPDYWNPDAQHWDVIEIKYFSDTSARQNALRSGEVDVANLEASSVAQTESAGFALETKSAGAWSMLIKDRDGTLVPAFADVRVRQAMAYAVDREGFVASILQGYGEPSTQPYRAGTEFYDDNLEGEYEYDPEKARELLAEAGYADGFSFTADADSMSKDALTAIQGMYGEVGIDMKIEIVQQPDPTSVKFPVFMNNFPYSGEPAQSLAIFIGDSPLNPFDVDTSELEGLQDEITETTDAEARKALNDEFLETIVDQGVMIFVATPDSTAAYDDSKVANVAWRSGTEPTVNLLNITAA